MAWLLVFLRNQRQKDAAGLEWAQAYAPKLPATADRLFEHLDVGLGKHQVRAWKGEESMVRDYRKASKPPGRTGDLELVLGLELA
jgi:hypothetical protein